MKSKKKLAKEVKKRWACIPEDGTFSWCSSGVVTWRTRRTARIQCLYGEKVVRVLVTVEQVR